MEAIEAVNKTIGCAAAFQRRHPHEKGIGTTFGYFTRHPVAPLNRKRLVLLLNRLQAQSRELGRPLRVLDLACGGGVITCAAASLGHRALGLDLSEEEVRLAKLFAQEERLDGTFWKADLLQDSFWEKTAAEVLGGKPDAVLLAYALHHLPQVEHFVDRLGRWLEPKARLHINEENPNAPFFRLKHQVRTWIQRDTEVEWHRTYEGWKELLESRGFQVTPPEGTDLMPGLGTLFPAASWSLVFEAVKG